MPRKPVVHQRRIIADTGILTVEQLDLEFSNGARRLYQRIVGTRDSVLVVAVAPDQDLLLIREYATGMERYELAFPKGVIEPAEDPLQAANRELQEETGYAARRLEALRCVTLAPGYLQHSTHLVMAWELYPRRLPGDEPELIEVIAWPLRDWASLLSRPDFTEARSIAALLMVRDRLLGRPEIRRHRP